MDSGGQLHHGSTYTLSCHSNSTIGELLGQLEVHCGQVSDKIYILGSTQIRAI